MHEGRQIKNTEKPNEKQRFFGFAVPRLGLGWPRLVPSWPKLGPSWPQVGPSLPQVGQSWPQVGSKSTHAGGKLAQNYLKTTPRYFKRHPETEKIQGILNCIFFAMFRPSRKIENVLPTEGGKHFFENGKCDVHVDCDNMKIYENRKCAPHRGREALF